MSYAALGQTEADVAASCPWPWQEPQCPPACYCNFYGLYYDTDEVYVFRLTAKLPSPIDTSSKALLFARALGEGFMRTDTSDVRGVAFEDLGQGRYQVDIVYTTTDDGVPIAQKNDTGLTEALSVSPLLRDEFPGLVVEHGRRLQLLDKGAIAYWLSAPVVWSAQTRSVTQAYGRGDNVWHGTAAQRQAQLQPKEPTPVGPGGGNGGGIFTGKTSSTTIVGAVVIGAILWMALRRKGST